MSDPGISEAVLVSLPSPCCFKSVFRLTVLKTLTGAMPGLFLFLLNIVSNSFAWESTLKTLRRPWVFPKNYAGISSVMLCFLTLLKNRRFFISIFFLMFGWPGRRPVSFISYSGSFIWPKVGKFLLRIPNPCPYGDSSTSALSLMTFTKPGPLRLPLTADLCLLLLAAWLFLAWSLSLRVFC